MERDRTEFIGWDSFKIKNNQMKHLLKYSFKVLFFLLLTINLSAQDLEIEGSIKIAEGAQAGYVLKSDATGVGIWSPQADADRKQIYATDFGAKGDGVADDTNALQEAINSAGVQGGTVHIPVGNYKITQTLSIPAGVKLQGDGLGNSIGIGANSTTGTRISFYGNNEFAMEFFGDFHGCSNLSIVDVGGEAQGGINFIAEGGKFGIGATFNDVFLSNFTNGTAIKLTATGVSGIAWSSFENIHIRNAKRGVHIDIADDGSFINLVTFRSINIAGSGFEYGLFVDGPVSSTDWYGVSMQADCPTQGHIVLDTKGYVNIYGIHIESTDACSEETVLIELKEDTRGSYIHGSAGKGRILDKGSNFIDLAGTSGLGLRPSGNNLLQNAAFKGVNDNTIPYWEFKTADVPENIEVLPAEWAENHQVLKITIGAGKSVRLGQQGTYFSDGYQYKECLFGAMVKTANDISVFPYYQNCGGANSSAGSPHPKDGQWHYIGKPSEVDPTASCQPNPQFIFDNSSNGSAAIVYITTPSFNFNRGKMPALEAGPITTAGGIMTGTLTTSMLEVASPSDNTLELSAAANLFQISGTNTINSINLTSAIFPKGTRITLLFETENLRVIHNAAAIKLLGNKDYRSEDYSTLQLVSLGDGIWQEVDRNCLNGCSVNAVKPEISTSTIPINSEEDIVLIYNAEELMTNTVKIYPNPTQHGIYIDLEQVIAQTSYSLQIIDSSGRLIFKQSLSGSNNWIDFAKRTIDDGHYRVQVFANDQLIANRGLVVMKDY